MSKRQHYAVLGTNGLNYVVWGIGTSERAAERDAREWDAPSCTTTLPITRRQYALVKEGVVCCQDLGIKVKAQADGRLKVAL